VRCRFKDDSALGPGGLPCTFDWANEPNPPLEAKGRGATKVWTPKAPPKRCTVACRQYAKPDPIALDLVEPYTADDIMAREREVLGTWLSGTPFDRLDPEELEILHTASDVHEGPSNAEYVVAALVETVRKKIDLRNNPYAFATLNARDGVLDAVCFASVYSKYGASLRSDALVLAVLWKTDNGVQITAIAPAL
jgi:DNA polymerase III alpha subunit